MALYPVVMNNLPLDEEETGCNVLHAIDHLATFDQFKDAIDKRIRDVQELFNLPPCVVRYNYPTNIHGKGMAFCYAHVSIKEYFYALTGYNLDGTPRVKTVEKSDGTSTTEMMEPLVPSPQYEMTEYQIEKYAGETGERTKYATISIQPISPPMRNGTLRHYLLSYNVPDDLDFKEVKEAFSYLIPDTTTVHEFTMGNITYKDTYPVITFVESNNSKHGHSVLVRFPENCAADKEAFVMLRRYTTKSGVTIVFNPPYANEINRQRVPKELIVRTPNAPYTPGRFDPSPSSTSPPSQFAPSIRLAPNSRFTSADSAKTPSRHEDSNGGGGGGGGSWKKPIPDDDGFSTVSRHDGRGNGRGGGGYQSRGDFQDRGGYQPRGDFQGRGGYQPRGNFQPRGEYQPRGNFQERGGYQDGRGGYQPRGGGEYQQNGGRGGSRGGGRYVRPDFFPSQKASLDAALAAIHHPPVEEESPSSSNSDVVAAVEDLVAIRCSPNLSWADEMDEYDELVKQQQAKKNGK